MMENNISMSSQRKPYESGAEFGKALKKHGPYLYITTFNKYAIPVSWDDEYAYFLIKSKTKIAGHEKSHIMICYKTMMGICIWADNTPCRKL